MRFERKIPIYGYDDRIIREYIRIHPAGFREIHHTRMVNNIYFDTPSLECGLANVEGHRERTKFRIRWYGRFQGKIKDPRLELKMKQDHLGSKEVFKLPPFQLNKQFNSKMIKELIQQSAVPQKFIQTINSMKPVLLNSYSRTYFQSLDRCFRITLDTDLKWGNIPNSEHGNLRLQREENSIILEIKYDKKFDDMAETITSRFPWRVSKNSKYMNALYRLY